ncbi:TPA: single-stranded-DNA-specific exonuclease RecJ [Proteus mirabilis]|uniref:single-stranded-DNA-specific exonuclease RecJ n=1 Tax=Proteus mirabilis TaxID=584 RepID=UPI000DF9D3BF|nr:single-stranded-DNA-specific exonuclease RecJ [Proteus mirabilis]EKU9858106.1 single-stranded-DNA-specific exonuclease RecJ [Proteus mirabilis]EKW3342498.1 single-stranded-DNA-specific exonuclease RecJ [Proteus mirabilis]EKW4126340.1 single-stranded-DNA-specific exonuclease RecJ [Proteus mirabilis]ELA9899305.1 single-stranded-DNA-specific exonuclease RecJ [Proteus mirabilis]MBI6285170.1 single-stranded-DNA-specific exonuclease RecJ [Proteus mirabilis]
MVTIEPTLRRRVAKATALPESLDPLLRQIYANRGITSETQLERSLKGLLHYQDLNGIDVAISLLVEALKLQSRIVIVGDFDADGATSTALAIKALRQMGFQQVSYHIPNRFDDGYGLSPQVVHDVAKKGVDLIITVDNGISSFEGVDVAHEYGIRVLVTDHHLPGHSLPQADAIINPNLADCAFLSKSLAGVGVTFYLMTALRAELEKQGWFTAQGLARPNMADYLDLVALGTVADVVPLDENNRIFVYEGLRRIRAGRCCAGIKALTEVSRKTLSQLVSSDLGFALGPRLNAAGRLDDMSVGVALLLTNDIGVAREIANELDGLNQTRREIEAGMQEEASTIFRQFITTQDDLPNGLAIYHPQWHQGVVGILASRIKEKLHRPVIAFAPSGDGLLKGSGRSIHGVHLRDALERLNTLNPGLMVKFGGHAMAAGLSLEEDKFPLFQRHFSALMAELVSAEQLQGVILTDGELSDSQLSLSIAEMLREAGPWGQAFPEPLFDGKFTLLQQRIVGSKHLKMMLQPINSHVMIDAIAFNVDVNIWPDNSIKTVELAYRLDVNEFRGQRNAQLLVEHIWPC